MALSIHERLSCIEDQFLQAAIQGTPALTVFHDSWSKLLLDIEHAVKVDSIDGKTMSLRNAVAPRVSMLSGYLLDFHTAVETMSSSLHTELDAIFARISISDDDTPHQGGQILYLQSLRHPLAFIHSAPRAHVHYQLH